MTLSRDMQSFILALVVVIGGGLLLRFPPPNVVNDTAQFTVLFGAVSGAIGTVLGFFYANRSATSAVETSTRATNALSSSNGTTVTAERATVTGSPVNMVEPK